MSNLQLYKSLLEVVRISQENENHWSSGLWTGNPSTCIFSSKVNNREYGVSLLDEEKKN